MIVADPALVRITHRNQVVSGPVTFCGVDSLWSVQQFNHEVGDGRFVFNGFREEWKHKHKPMSLVLEFGGYAPLLYKTICSNSVLDKIEIFWLRYSEEKGNTEIYFVTAVYPVKINSTRLFFPNVYSTEFENTGHLFQFQFRYRWIEWEYTKGKHWVKKEWVEYLRDEYHCRNVQDFKEILEITSGYMLTDDLPEPQKELSIYTAGWEHLDNTLRKDTPSAAAEGNRIRLFADVSGAFDGEKIRFQLYYRKATGNCIQFTEVSGKIKAGTGTADWDVDLSKIKERDFEIHFEPVVRGKYGKPCNISLLKRSKIIVPWFIDCHCHINAPKCAPLPVIWVQNALIQALKPSWDFMENRVVKKLISLTQHELADYASMSTDDLGNRLVQESGKVMVDRSFNNFFGPPEQRKRIHIIMPMDMELASYHGYDGKTVYLKDKHGNSGYWSYEDEGKRKWVSLKKKGVQKMEAYIDQVKATSQFCRSTKGLALPFFHYDPRRWQGIADSTWTGMWYKPFEYLLQSATSDEKLNEFFGIGFKMYTALGYRPDDYKDRKVYSRSKHKQKKKLQGRLPDMYDFYEKCVNYKIPIICHGSCGGVFAHDYMLYYDYLFPAENISDDEKMEFFREVFVSPWAWESVLQDFPKLYLCLAHFGGEEAWCKDWDKPDNWVGKMVEMMERYDNFYIDLSYYIFIDRNRCKRLSDIIQKHPKVKTKLLFGTDWYLIGSERSKYGHYDSFVKSMSKNLYSIDEELCAYCMVINPKRFLNLEYIADKLYVLFGSEWDIRELVKKTMYSSIDQFYEPNRCDVLSHV